MTNKYDDLIDAIEKKISTLSLELENSNDKRVEYLDQFFDKYNIKSPITFLNVTDSELLLAMLMEADRETNPDILIEQVEEIKSYINDSPLERIRICCDLSRNVDNDTINRLENDISFLLTENKNMSKLVNILSNRSLKTISKRIERDLNIKLESRDYEVLLQFIKLIKLLMKIDKNNNLSILILAVYMHRRSDLININSTDDLSTILSGIILSFFGSIDAKAVEKSLTELYSYYRQIDKEAKSKIRDNNKRIYRYTELKKILSKEKDKKEITNIDFILDKILDDDIKKLCLEYIYEHNMAYYTELHDEYKYKSENSINKYISYFAKLGIDFNVLSSDIKAELMNIPLDSIKEKEKLLPNVRFDSNTRILIYCKASLSTIKEINNLLKKGYIDLEIISNNPNIYYDAKLFNNLKNNIKTLEKAKVNIRELSNKSILLFDRNIICNNIELLNRYNISIRGLGNIDMLMKENLDEQISLLVEIGLENDIVNHPELLNSDNNLAKRILIARFVGENPYDNGVIKASIIDKDSFFVSDKDVDNYLFDRDNSKYNSSLVVRFDDNEGSKISYDIEGIRIPKAKVSNLSVSLQTLVRTSLYSKEEIKKLEKHGK